MFAKLLKHEWRATGGTLGILSLAALGVSVLGGITLRMLNQYSEKMNELAAVSLVLSLVFICLALVAYAVAVEIIQLVRFYQSRYTDQGYLTFTLPVSAHQIFLSSFLNLLIWTVISMLVLAASAGIILLIGIPWDQIPNSELSMILQELSSVYDFEIEPAYIVIHVLQFIVGSVYSIVMAMTCLTVGAVVAKKHKIVAAFVAYYVISFLTSMISSILTVANSVRDMDYYLSPQVDMIYQATVRSMSLTIVWEVLLIVAGYFLSTHLMKKKLNLP